ncbi:hypothetical protein [Winogradskyella schleiferi]|uniref:hypothetical protein n=1 Tax=Winogradskyella schleiferi TaxID=2686078 RepID=UPI0015BB4D4F|nr:hypothetical protein [Winogradskyella schleiferi]
MKQFIPQTKDAIALSCVSIVALSWFVAGLCDVLDYIIIKVVLFLGFGILFVVAIIYGLKNDAKKNRPEDKLQDDSY